MSRKGRAEQKIKYAVVGLGHIAQAAVLPAFGHAGENCELAALVSDDPVKLRTLGKRYGVRRLCRYSEYDDLLRGGEIDAVYIALPNSLHCDFALRAVRAGIHVLCEKPLAVTEHECRLMIEEARVHGVRLMTAYRLHFEDANMEAVEIAKSGRLGELRCFESTFCMQVRAGDIRLNDRLGGGCLYDIGIYCINAARYLFQAEPEEVLAMTATGRDARFKQVEEACSAILRFPGGRLASFTCSFGAADVSSYRLVGTKGDLVCEPAYEYEGALGHRITIEGREKTREFPPRDQFAPELVYFSDCILDGEDPEPSGEEGLADVRVIEALYRSALERRPIILPPFERSRRPDARLEMRRPAIDPPKLIHTEPPHL